MKLLFLMAALRLQLMFLDVSLFPKLG